MKLRLHPDLVVAWRDAASLQIGLGHEHGVILDDLTPAAETVLSALRKGEHSLPGLRRLAGERGLAPTEVDRLVELLSASGAILAEPVIPLVRSRASLLPVARGVALRRPGVDGWVLMNRRLTTRVLIVGAAFVGARLARLLLGAGVGEVAVHDPRPLDTRDLDDPAYRPTDLGRPRHQVLAARVTGVLAVPDPSTLDCHVAVLTGSGALDPLVWDPFVSADIPHLSLVLGERGATIGPLVHPGLTCCLRCVELYRSDRDPSWPTVAAQASRHRFGPRDPLLLELTAVHTAAQLLRHVDEPESSLLAGVSLDLDLDDPVPVLRRWPTHPRCGCSWPQTTGLMPGPQP